MLEVGSDTEFQLFLLFNIVGPFLGLTRNLGARQGGPSPKRWLTSTSSKHILDVPKNSHMLMTPKLQNKLPKGTNWFLQVIKT